MVRARTTAELIRELAEEARFAGRAAPVVALDGSRRMVWSNDPDPTANLDRLRDAGGETIGIVRRGERQSGTRLFCEYADSEMAQAMMADIEPDPPRGSPRRPNP